MGEGLIVRRGGQAYKLPVLNESYPQDATVVASAGASAAFSVVISEPGNPAEYTYKWYKGGNLVSGATGSTLSLTGLTAATTTNIYCEVTNKAAANYSGNYPAGDGGSDGSNGGDGLSASNSSGYLGKGGKGQGTTTREFGEATGTLYAGGGASQLVAAPANYGGGGSQAYPAGGSGIVVIRNHREAA